MSQRQREPGREPGGMPTEFAVFPLPGALLLPGGKLPLNIFEPRYLAMVEDTLSSGRMLGMIQPDPSSVSGPHGPALFRVGCLGRVSSFSETDDGRFLITLDGLSRFEVLEELAPRRGYRRVRGDFSRFAGDIVPHEDGGDLPREAIVTELRQYFARGGMDANWEAIERMSDDNLLMTLSMICPFPPAEKQALLEAHDDQARAETLIALLRMGGIGGEDEDSARRMS